MDVLSSNLSVIKIILFDGSKKKGWKRPSSVSTLIDYLKEFQGESLTSLPTDLCKKDKDSGFQKRFLCTCCNIQIESVTALIQHVKSKRHLGQSCIVDNEKNSCETLCELAHTCQKESKHFETDCLTRYSIQNRHDIYVCSTCNFVGFVDQTFEHMKGNHTEVNDYVGNKIKHVFNRLDYFEKMDLMNSTAVSPAKRLKIDAESSSKMRDNCNESPNMTHSKHTITKEMSEESEYYFENGLRKVRPYHFTFNTYAKKRWLNKPLIHVLTKEFRAYGTSYYESCIKRASLTVNKREVTPEYIIKANDLISNEIHRHELPVLGVDLIEVIEENNNLVVINKPSSIPVHPCSKYRHNTVLFILGAQEPQKYRCLRPVHRLDRLTSGVLVFAKNVETAKHFESLIRSREVEKEYICKVEGRFPDSDEVLCTESLLIHQCNFGSLVGVVKSNDNLLKSSTVKPSQTVFQNISYDSVTNTSLVKAYPKTGRMHQIRVHLQYLGYPICNDPLYNHPTVFGSEKGKDGFYGGNRTFDDVIKQMSELHVSSKFLSMKKCDKDEKKLENFDEFCTDCSLNFENPKQDDLAICLHALSYSGPGFNFVTRLPAWAS